MSLMAVKVLPLAQEDVNQALIYIASDNPSAADDLYNSMMKALEQAAEFPYSAAEISIGRRYQRRYYKLYVKPYNIYYRIIHDTIIVMRVLHERMDTTKHLKNTL